MRAHSQLPSEACYSNVLTLVVCEVVDALLSKQKNSQLVFGLRVAEHHMLNALFFVVLNNQVQQFVDRAVNVKL